MAVVIQYPLYKLVSDGTPWGTKLLNADGSENPALNELFSRAAVRVAWEFNAGGYPRIYLEIDPKAVVIEAAGRLGEEKSRDIRPRHAPVNTLPQSGNG